MAAWTQQLEYCYSRIHVSAERSTGLPMLQPTCLHWDIQHPACLSFCVSPSRVHASTRIINSFPISYAFQPCLRGRLTPGRLPLPGKPWVYGEQVSHLFYRYSCQHNHFLIVQQTSQFTFTPIRNAPLPSYFHMIRSFGSMLSPVTFSAQRH